MRTYHIKPQDRNILVELLGANENRFLQVTSPDLLGGEKCVNCADAGGLHFEVKERVGFHEILIDHFFFYCPDCVDHTALINSMLDKTGIDKLDRHYRIDYIKDMLDKQIQYQWAVNKVSEGSTAAGFVLWRGDFGLGKTGLAKALVLHMARLPVYAHYTTGEYILINARSSFNGGRVSEQEIIREYCQYRILVIDELDIVSNTDYSIATLRTILNERYEMRDNKLTIMITNRVDDFWPYLFSRLDDGQIVDFSGESLRGL